MVLAVSSGGCGGRVVLVVLVLVLLALWCMCSGACAGAGWCWVVLGGAGWCWVVLVLSAAVGGGADILTENNEKQFIQAPKKNYSSKR